VTGHAAAGVRRSGGGAYAFQRMKGNARAEKGEKGNAPFLDPAQADLYHQAYASYIHR
jgi:hypothetical protein